MQSHMAALSSSRASLLLLFSSLNLAMPQNCTGKPRGPADIRRLWQGPSYDQHTRPELAIWQAEGYQTPGAPKDKVFLSLQLNTLQDVNTQSQTIAVEVFMRTMWFDRRLQYDPSCLSTSDLSGMAPFPGITIREIWTPHLNSKQLADVKGDKLDPNMHAFWIEPPNLVWWNRKVDLKVKCNMEFSHMPFDTHTCEFSFTDFIYTKAQIELGFPNLTQPFFYGLDGPIEYICTKKTGGSIDWTINSFTSNVLTDGSQHVFDMSSITYRITFTRSPEYFIRTAVIPMIMVVVLCWSSFFVSRTAMPARVAMVIIAYLALSGIMNTVSSTLPPLSGRVWLVELATCTQYFAMVAVLEVTMADFFRRIEGRIDSAKAAAKKALADKSVPAVQKTPGTVGSASSVTTQSQGDVIIEMTPPADDHTRPRTRQGNAALVAQMRSTLGPIARCLISKSGNPLIRDQYFDITMRFLFPVAYVIMLGVFWSKIPATVPEDPRLLAAC